MSTSHLTFKAITEKETSSVKLCPYRVRSNTEVTTNIWVEGDFNILNMCALRHAFIQALNRIKKAAKGFSVILYAFKCLVVTFLHSTAPLIFPFCCSTLLGSLFPQFYWKKDSPNTFRDEFGHFSTCSVSGRCIIKALLLPCSKVVCVSKLEFSLFFYLLMYYFSTQDSYMWDYQTAGVLFVFVASEKKMSDWWLVII